MITEQVIETSVTVNNNSPIQDYFYPDDQTQPTFEIYSWVQTFHSNIITKMYYHHYLFFYLNTIYFSILKQGQAHESS